MIENNETLSVREKILAIDDTTKLTSDFCAGIKWKFWYDAYDDRICKARRDKEEDDRYAANPNWEADNIANRKKEKVYEICNYMIVTYFLIAMFALPFIIHIFWLYLLLLCAPVAAAFGITYANDADNTPLLIIPILFVTIPGWIMLFIVMWEYILLNVTNQ